MMNSCILDEKYLQWCSIFNNDDEDHKWNHHGNRHKKMRGRERERERKCIEIKR